MSAVQDMASLRTFLQLSLLSQPFPSLKLLFRNNSPGFLLIRLAASFHALGIRAAYMANITLRDTEPPEVLQASTAEHM